MSEETKPTTAPAAEAAKPAAAAAPTGTDGPMLNPDGTEMSDKQKKKLAEKQAKEKKKAETAARLAAEKAAREAADVDFAKQNYGDMPLNRSQERNGIKFADIADFSAEKDGEPVVLIARIMTTRAPSAKMAFLQLRDGLKCTQAVLAQAPEKVSKQMVKWAQGLVTETLVQVEGTIVKTASPVQSQTVTVKDAEVKISKIHVISHVRTEAPLPFAVDDAVRSEAEVEASQSTDRPMPSITLDTRLNNRVLDLRTATNQAVFRVQHGVCRLFREFLENREFIEIHSPKLQGAATESGASVFKVDYFKGKAFLAQSPQLAKQMAISADFGRVYEIGPVFRAEDSNTPRHMTEFTGLDLEMSFKEHYHEVVDVLEGLFLFLFTELPKRYKKEIDIVRRQFPGEDFKVPERMPRLHFKEAVALLREAGEEIGDFDDLSTEQERVLGRKVLEKYNSDFFMLDKFPLAVRPFYTMPDATDGNYSNSYDCFMKGQEILSGAQRVHDAPMLEERMKAVGIEPSTMKSYVDAFRMGCPPHAGAGIGLERVVMFYLGLGNIRRASLLPRDPKRLDP